MANEFKVKNGLIVIGDLTTSGTITINGALAATQSWVTSQAYLTSASLSGYATQSYVTSALAALVDAAPAALDTLNELAAALGDDANFSTTITNSIASKQAQLNGTGLVRMSGTSVSYDNTTYLVSNFGNIEGEHSYGYPSSDGWYKIAEVVFNGSCQSYNLWGEYRDTGYFDNSHYRIHITARAECDFPTNNESHAINVNMYGSSTNETYFNNNVRVVLTSSSSNYRKYELQYYRATWDTGSWNLQTLGWTTYTTSQTAGTPTGTPRVYYISKFVADNIYAANKISIGTTYSGFAANIAGTTYVIGASVWVNDGYGITNASSGGTGFFPYSDGTLVFNSVNSEKMRIAPSGNVGIGTNSPSALLDVNGRVIVGGGLNGNAFSIATSIGTYTFNNYNLNTPSSFLITAGSSGYLSLDGYPIIFKVLGSETMRVHTSGNIGIGTDSPTHLLSLSRATQAAAYQLNINNAGGISDGNFTGIRFSQDSNAATELGNIKLHYYSTGATDLSFGTRYSPTALYIQSGGNVGIGTTGPEAKLHIVSGSGQAGFLSRGTNGDTWFPYSNGQNYVRGVTNFDSGSVYFTGGNIGIGTTSPSHKLHIKSSSLNSYPLVVQRAANTNNIFYIYEDGSGNGTLTLENSGGGAAVSIKSDGTSYLNGGNVGIGTTSPGNILTVNGDTRLVTGTTQGLFAYDAPSGGAFIWSLTRYTDTNANDLNVNTRSGFGIRTGVESLTNSGHQFYVTSVGNVGIGTTSPTQKLHVVGNQYITGTITVGASGNNSNVNFVRGDGSGVGGIGWRSDGTFYVGGHIDYGPTAGNRVRVYGFGELLSLGNSQAGDILNITTSGTVGIGTTSPREKLQIVGNTVIGSAGLNSYKTNLYLTYNAGSDETWVRIYVPQDYNSSNNGGTIRVRVLWEGDHATFGAYQDYQISYKTFYPSSPYLKFSNVLCTNKTSDFATGSTYYLPSSTPDVLFYDNTDGYLYVKVKGTHTAYNTARYIEAEIFGRTTAQPTIATTSAPGAPVELTKTIQFLPQEGNIYASGSIGIGTTSPNQKLSVEGGSIQLNANNAAANYYLFLNKKSGQDGGILFNRDNASDWQLTNGSGNGDLIFYSYGTGTEAITFKRGTGYVGIGTTSPDNKLTVKGDNALIDVQSTADGQTIGFLARYLNSATLGGAFRYTTGDAQLYIDNFYQGNNGVYSDINIRNCDTVGNLINRIKIKGSNGNVGIGTSSPGWKLHVAGESYTSGVVRIGGTNPFYFEDYGGGWFMSDSTWVRTSNSKSVWVGGGLLGGDGGLTIGYGGTGSPSGGAIIAGNVGIGTSSPGAKLHVVGKSIFENNMRIYPASESWAEGLSFIMPTTVNWGGLRWQRQRGNSDGNWYVGFTALDSTDDLVFGANNGGSQVDNIIRLTKAGNVGVGTSAPTTKLDVRGNFLLKGDATDGGILTITRRYSTGAQTINFNNNHPSTNLDWTGARITSADSGNYNGYLDFAVSLGSNGNEAAGTAAVASVMRLTKDGYVGIGTTAPATSLEVQGAANTSIQAIFQSSSSGNAAYNGGIQLGNAGSNQKSSIVHTSAGDNTLTFTSHYSSGSANKFIFAPGGTETVRFQQNGNVGIGMSPASNERFSVNAAEGIWALSAYRSGVQIGGIHLNDSILNIQGAGGNEVRLSTTGNATWNGDILATRAWVGAQGYLTSVSDIWVNTAGDTMTGSLSFSEASVIKKKFTTGTSNPVKTASGVLTSRSDNSGGYTYYVIETNVPQDNYQMGGFTIELFGNYSGTNHKTKIDLGGYWNPEGNGGFLGFEAHGTNPQYKPTIEVARNSAGNTAFIIYGSGWNYPVIVARDLWLGYNSTDPGTYGEGWSISGTNDISSYTNKDTVVWRNAYSDSNPAGYITGYTETDTLQSVTSRGASTNTGLYINNNNPTLYLQDTDHRSAMIHVNSNYFYILNGAGTNSTGWEQQANSRWLFMGNLNNNDITFGGSGDFAGTVTASGGNSSNWNTAYGWGNHASAGYLTSETDTLASVTGRGATTSTNISVNNVKIGTDGTYGGGYSTIGFGGTTNGYNRVFGQVGTSDGLFLASATGRGIYFRVNGGSTDNVTINSSGNVAINTANFTYVNGDNASVISGVVPTANKLFIDGSIQLLNNTDAIVIGRGASTFLTDEELGFGWGGGWYMIDGSYLRVRNNISVYSTGSFYGSIFYDVNDANYYGDFAGTSRLNNLYIEGGVASLYNASGYGSAAIEVRERNFAGAQDDTWATAPRIGFHWGGRVAAQIALASNGRIHILNDPGTANEGFQAAIIYSSGYGDSTQWNTAYGWGNHASQSYATTSYVTTQINNLVNGAPGALDTLNELATALGNDASFSTTVTNSIAGKVSKAGDTITTANQYGLVINHTPVLGDFVDALLVRSSTSGQRAQIGFATVDADGDHHRASIRAYKGPGTLEGAFGIALRQAGSGAHIQRFTLDYLGNVTIGGFLTESSSLKLKENIETSEGNLEKVVNLRPVTYNKIGSQTTELGLIAEEVATVYPEFVQYDESGEPVGVNYSRLTAALIGAVKELTNQVQELNKKING